LPFHHQAWKKLVLVGFMALVFPGTLQQLLIAFLFSLMHLLIIAVSSPWTSDFDDFVAKACSFSTAAVFFFCVILKVQTLTEVCATPRHSPTPRRRRRRPADAQLP